MLGAAHYALRERKKNRDILSVVGGDFSDFIYNFTESKAKKCFMLTWICLLV